MLNSIYRHALENRERILGALDEGTGGIIEKAKKRWNEFERTGAKPPRTLGVDGSYNNVRYQGIEFWIATSVASRPDGEAEVVIRPEMGFERSSQPKETMHRLETEACAQATSIADLVLMDGSLLAGLAVEGGESHNRLVGIVQGSKSSVAFVSKTSDANGEFGAMAGDIYYYNRASDECGFSDIFVKRPQHGGLPISLTYVRLAHSAPLIKIEMLGEIKDDEVTGLITDLYEQSVGGYPSALRQAHNLCTVTNEDVEKIAMIMGAQGVVGAREVLR